MSIQIQKQKKKNAIQRQGVTMIYDLLKVMSLSHEPLSRSRIFQSAYLTSKTGPKYLKQAHLLGYIQEVKKQGKHQRYTIYPKFELTKNGWNQIYKIEQFHKENGVVLDNSRKVDST